MNTWVQGGAVLSDLRAFSGVAKMTVFTVGATTPGDGGAGAYYWDSSSTAADNGTTVIAPSGFITGRWLAAPLLVNTVDLVVTGSLTVHGTITQPTTGDFFANDGATIDRFNDRIFVGGATVNDGDQPNVVKDWLSQVTGLGYAVTIAQMAVLSSFGQIGFTTASRTSDTQAPGVSSFGTAIGLGAWGFNDKVDAVNSWDAWGAYIEARTAQENQGTTWGIEVDVMSYGGHLTPSTPYAHFVPYGGFGISISSGAGQSGANDATVALAVQNNGAKWLTGIKFDDNAISGADGTSTSGSGEAIALARGHQINFYNEAGVVAASVQSTQTSAVGATNLTFTNVGLSFADTTTDVFGVGTTAPAFGLTNLSILINNTASGVTYQQVFLGAPDSGGTGNRAIVVPN